MPDNFQATATWSKTSYIPGELIVGTVSGTNTHTEEATSTTTVGPVTIPLATESGVKHVYTLAATEVVHAQTVTTVEDIFIDTTRPIVDASATTPRNWIVSTDRKSIQATA